MKLKAIPTKTGRTFTQVLALNKDLDAHWTDVYDVIDEDSYDKHTGLYDVITVERFFVYCAKAPLVTFLLDKITDKKIEVRGKGDAAYQISEILKFDGIKQRADKIKELRTDPEYKEFERLMIKFREIV